MSIFLCAQRVYIKTCNKHRSLLQKRYMNICIYVHIPMCTTCLYQDMQQTQVSFAKEIYEYMYICPYSLCTTCLYPLTSQRVYVFSFLCAHRHVVHTHSCDMTGHTENPQTDNEKDNDRGSETQTGNKTQDRISSLL